MTEQNNFMILISGCLLIVWTTFKWKIPHVIWDHKSFRLYACILGSYNIVLVLIYSFLKVKIDIFFLIIDYIFFLLLNVGFITVKIKKARNGMIKNIQLGVCLLLIFCTFGIVYISVDEIPSSIMGLCGVMMLLSTPFEEIKPFLKGEK